VWRKGSVRSVDGVSFAIRRGEVMGLVGESGCGKSTLARVLLRLLPPDSGTVTIAGRDLSSLHGEESAPVPHHDAAHLPESPTRRSTPA